MEKYHQDRLEPEVEVGHEPEYLSGPSSQMGATRHAPQKKWGVVPIILVGLMILALGLWIFLPPGLFSNKKQEESLEFIALKEDVLKLRSEISPLKNAIQSLQTEQKGLLEQLTGLKDKLTVLEKKTEAQGERKASPKATLYKIQKGDTLSSIAKKFQVRPEDIRRWNHLPSKALPKPGKTLTLHPHPDS